MSRQTAILRIRRLLEAESCSYPVPIIQNEDDKTHSDQTMKYVNEAKELYKKYKYEKHEDGSYYSFTEASRRATEEMLTKIMNEEGVPE